MTFTWDLESAYISYVNYYRIFYRESYPGASAYTYRTYSTTTPSGVSRINSGETFTFITAVSNFPSFGQYILWLRVDITITPSFLYSEQIYDEFGECISCNFTTIYVLFQLQISTVKCTYSMQIHILIIMCIIHTVYTGVQVAIELNIKMWNEQTCPSFTVSTVCLLHAESTVTESKIITHAMSIHNSVLWLGQGLCT